MHGGVGIVWMDLYGEVGIRIEYLDEQGELIAGKASEQLAVIAPESREGRPLEGTANDGTVARRMGRYRPALPYGTIWQPIACLLYTSDAADEL